MVLPRIPLPQRAAIENNYAIEVDIRPSADAAAMVFHDATLDCMTGRGGRVEQISAERHSTVCDLAAARRPSRHLTNLLNLSPGGQGYFWKSRPMICPIPSWARNSCTPILAFSFLCRTSGGDVVRSASSRRHGTHGAADPTWVCFARISRTRRSCQTWRTWMLVRRNLNPVIETRARFVAYDAQALPAPALARRAGFRLLSWTVRDEAEKRRIAASVDQIIFEGFRP